MFNLLPKYHFSLFIFLFLLIPLLAGSCSRNDDQNEFEREAFRPAAGITETNSAGEVIGSPDPDDWRVSPMYQGLVEVHLTAFPNPTQGDMINIELYISQDALYEIEAYTYLNDDMQTGGYRQLHYDNHVDPGFYSLSIAPERFGHSYENARGTHRVFIADRNQNLITYGDIRVE